MVELTQVSQSDYSPVELYHLLAAQVASYQKHYHLGASSSIPTELARELLESIQYTLRISPTLLQGQEVLSQQLEETRKLHKLVLATGDQGNAWWWETMDDLGKYLDRYDHLHFAHQIPENLSYPTALPVPDGISGIHWAWVYLQYLWQENQILSSFPPDALEELEAHMPPGYWDGPELLCQQPLWNGLGRALLDLPLDSLLLTPAQWQAIVPLVSPGNLSRAADTLCRALALPEQAERYARAVIGEAVPRLTAALPSGNLSCIFL